MSPPRVEEYVTKLFSALKVEVISDVQTFNKEYPLFAAVNRAANAVERHQGRIIFLEYKPPNPAKKTLMLVGKGVTYDTGGADIKAGGIMAGMSRDKCGAAAVAGFMQVISCRSAMGFNLIFFVIYIRLFKSKSPLIFMFLLHFVWFVIQLEKSVMFQMKSLHHVLEDVFVLGIPMLKVVCVCQMLYVE